MVLRGANVGVSLRLSSVPAGAGSSKGALTFPDDPYLSPLHATFFYRESQLYVRDEGGLSGTFVRIRGSEMLPSGSHFSVGSRLVRFTGPLAPPASTSPLPYGAPITSGSLYTLEQVYEGARLGRACTRPGPVLSVGRAGCDLNFPTDAHVQSRHCEVAVDPTGALLKDLGSPEGTFIRLSVGAERALVPGDVVRIGLQMLRVESG